MASSPWAEIASWLLLPALACAQGAGLALLLERVFRARVPGGLLIPAGFAIAVLLAFMGHAIGLPFWVTVALLLALPAAGLVVGSERSRALPGGGAAAGLLTYLLFLSPVLLTGHWTWTGYNFLNDTSVQMLLASWIKSGAGVPPLGISSTGNTIFTYVHSDYPLGSHAHLATLTAPLGIGPEIGYQSYISVLSAIGAMAAHYLLRVAGLRSAYAAAAAVAAFGANLTLQYALQGSLKEIAFAAALMVTAASAQWLLESRSLGLAATLLGVGAATCLAVYSAAALPYLGVLALVAVAGLAARARRERLPASVLARTGGVAVIVAFVLAIPQLGAIVGFARTVTGAFAATGGAAPSLGQLQAPLPALQGLGVWLSGEYVFRPHGMAHLLTYAADAAIAVLVAAGLAYAAARARWSILLGGLPAIVALAVIAPTVVPYVDAKMLAIVGPSAILVAALVPGLLLARHRVLGAGLASVLAFAILASDALSIRNVRLAPTDRMAALNDLGHRYAGQGLMLFNEFEEFAKYFMRDARVNTSTDSTGVDFIVLRHATSSFFGYSFDLDAQELAYVEKFPLIVTRLGPTESRPPSNYRLDYRNKYYAVWRREGAPPAAHLSLSRRDSATATPACRTLRGFAARAPAGTRLVAARAPQNVPLDIRNAASVPRGWPPSAFRRGELALDTPGTATWRERVAAGDYDVWVRGSFGRAMRLSVDGRRAGSVDEINTPGAWLHAGRIRLPSGVREVSARRPGARPLPGDGALSTLGAVSFVRREPSSLVTVPRRRAGELCGRAWDWVEAVR